MDTRQERGGAVVGGTFAPSSSYYYETLFDIGSGRPSSFVVPSHKKKKGTLFWQHVHPS